MTKVFNYDYDTSIKRWKKRKEEKEEVIKRLNDYKSRIGESKWQSKFYTGDFDETDKRIKEEQQKIKKMKLRISNLKNANKKFRR